MPVPLTCARLVGRTDLTCLSRNIPRVIPRSFAAKEDDAEKEKPMKSNEGMDMQSEAF